MQLRPAEPSGGPTERNGASTGEAVAGESATNASNGP